jgi:hypothetical protein
MHDATIMNWPVGLWDRAVCRQEIKIPDRRCNDGYRTELCTHRLDVDAASSPAAICDAIAAHAARAHGYAPDAGDGLCHEITPAGDCSLPAGHGGYHDWEGR